MRLRTYRSLLLLALAWGASPIHALVRMAIVVGSNHGLPEEKPLSYAAQDARRVHETFQQLGALDRGRGWLLLDPSVERVRAVIGEARVSLRALAAKGEKVQVLFYFSGHGSERGFHMSGAAMSLEEVRAFLRGAEADLKVFIADACYSGSLIQAKGAILAAPVPVRLEDELKVSGSAILTSSSAGELSHESHDLQGSLFTHYLLSGLRGAADYDRDGRITLWEAYTHTQGGLRRRLAVRQDAAQTPGFDVDVHGSGNVILARLDMGQSFLTLKGLPRGDYHILEAATVKPVAEVSLSEPEGMVLALPSASYLIYHPKGKSGLAGYADLRKSHRAVMGPDDLSPVPAGFLASKGRVAPLPPRQGLGLALQPRYYPRYPGGDGHALAVEAVLGATRGRWEGLATALSLSPRRLADAGPALRQDGFGASLTLRRHWVRTPAWAFHTGTRGEYWVLRQRVDRLDPTRADLAGAFLAVGLDRRLGRRFRLGLIAETGAFLSYDAEGGRRFSPTAPLSFTLGFGP